MTEVRDEYITALFELCKADPAKWATFVETFKAYTIEELERITTSPVQAAAIAIGYGRRMKEQRDDFIQIETLMNKIRK